MDGCRARERIKSALGPLARSVDDRKYADLVLGNPVNDDIGQVGKDVLAGAISPAPALREPRRRVPTGYRGEVNLNRAGPDRPDRSEETAAVSGNGRKRRSADWYRPLRNSTYPG